MKIHLALPTFEIDAKELMSRDLVPKDDGYLRDCLEEWLRVHHEIELDLSQYAVDRDGDKILVFKETK